MPNTHLSAIPYPAGSDAPAAAADMMEAFVHLDSRTVLPALDQADRNAKYADAPAGAFVVAGPSKTVWFKHGPGPSDWTTIYEDTGWVNKGFVVASGWEINTHLLARRVNKSVEIRGQMTRTGADIPANLVTNPGNIADTALCSIPPQFWPNAPTTVVGSFLGYVTGGTMSLTSSGNIHLRDAHPGSKISTGEWLQFSLSFFQDKEVAS